MTWSWQWFTFSLIIGFICSANWIYTSICFILVAASTNIYYAFAFKYFDVVSLMISALSVITLIYATFIQEVTHKQMIV
jgi:hypothetical protein